MTSADKSNRSHHELPIDPDVDVAEDARHHHGALPDVAPRSPWPRFRASVVAAVFVGGCLGGLVRYAVTQHWPTPDAEFPWPTFAVNVVGAFVLAALVVIVTEVLRDSTYARPLLGTGFCGALTTFSSVVVAVDRLVAHGHAGVGITYLLASIAAGIVAGALGLILARSYAAAHVAARESAR